MIPTAEPLEELLEGQLHADPRALDVARHLLEAAFSGDRGVQRRRPVIAGDGTPILLSFQENGLATPPPFRLLVEPGLTSLSVSEQIDFSLATMNRVLASLAWNSSAPVVNDVVRALFPSRADAVDSWWGGMGLGMSVDSRGLELRLYCNVREGDVARRWSRIGAVLAHFGALDLGDEALRAFIERTSLHAVPAGLALSIRDGRAHGLRLYLSVSQPDVDVIAALGNLDNTQTQAIAAICAAYPDVRPFTYGCVTVAYDFAFARDRATLTIVPVRFKADFDCTVELGSPCSKPEMMRRWLAQRHEALGLPADRMLAFCDTLQRMCGRYETDYVSFGWRAGAPEITTYVLPSGYATL
ncbi:MAG: hypothetical protein ACYDA1_04260 [Vulcanimicrobiaceae bacterium]